MTTERSPNAQDRKLRNFLIAPSKQFKLVILAIALGITLFLAFFGFELWIITSVMKGVMVHVPDPTKLNPLIDESVRTSWIAFIVAGVFFAGIVTATIFIITHRFYGPEVALRKHVAAIRSRDYSHRTHLRKSDEFKELAAELNQLSEQLANSSGS